MSEAEVQRLMGLADEYAIAERGEDRGGSDDETTAARAALESALRELLPAGHLKADDVFTLIGHAEKLRMDGNTDMPAYFQSLAARIARSIGDEAMAARVEEISAASTTAPAPQPTVVMARDAQAAADFAAWEEAVAAPAAPEVPADAQMLEWLLTERTTLDNGGLFMWFRVPPAFIAAGLDPRESAHAAIRAAMAAPTPQEQKP